MNGRIVRYDPDNATRRAYERSPEFAARRKAIKRDRLARFLNAALRVFRRG